MCDFLFSRFWCNRYGTNVESYYNDSTFHMKNDSKFAIISLFLFHGWIVESPTNGRPKYRPVMIYSDLHKSSPENLSREAVDHVVRSFAGQGRPMARVMKGPMCSNAKLLGQNSNRKNVIIKQTKATTSMVTGSYILN